MDVVRAGHERHPGRARRAAGPLAAGLQRRPRRRLPGRARHPRPRLGRRSARLARRSWRRCASRALVTDVDSDYQVGMPEVQVIPDRNKAADLGISMAEIGETINAAIGGERVGKFKDKGRRYDIRVRLLAQQRQRPEDIERLFVRTRRRRPGAPRGHRAHRAAADAAGDHAPGPRAGDHDLRQRGAGRVPGRGDRPARSRSRARSCPTAIAPCPPAAARPSRSRSTSLLFAFGLGLVVAYMVLAVAVQRLHPPLHGAAGAALQHQRRPARAVVWRARA